MVEDFIQKLRICLDGGTILFCKTLALWFDLGFMIRLRKRGGWAKLIIPTVSLRQSSFKPSTCVHDSEAEMAKGADTIWRQRC